MRHLEGLTYHEALRYDYLSKNIHYLSAKENAELTYLKAKLTGTQPRIKDENILLTASHKHKKGKRNPVKKWDNPLPSYTNAPSNQKLIVPEKVPGLPVYQPSRRLQAKRQTCQQSKIQKNPATVSHSRKKTVVNPSGKGKGRLLKNLLRWMAFILLALLVGMAVMFFKGVGEVNSGDAAFTPAQTEVFHGMDTSDGINILILGSDKRITQNAVDARTDTIMVMNIGGDDKKVKTVSFMRDTLVNIPGYSNDDHSADFKLNASFNLGEQNGGEGAEFVRQTLKHNFDLDIKYYMMVDFETFTEAIDTLFPEGVEIDAQFATVSNVDVNQVEVPDDLGFAKGGPQFQQISEGIQYMDGKTLLNYARYRSDDEGDFGRTKRQQQVLSAVLEQVKDPRKLFTGSAALGKLYSLTSTNVSYPLLLTEGLNVALNGKEGIVSETIPAQGDWKENQDKYGGVGLEIDRDKYQKYLADLGL